MKKQYTTPAIQVAEAASGSIICTSLGGIEGTASMNTSVSHQEETDEYLSRSRNNLWDDGESVTREDEFKYW